MPPMDGPMPRAQGCARAAHPRTNRGTLSGSRQPVGWEKEGERRAHPTNWIPPSLSPSFRRRPESIPTRLPGMTHPRRRPEPQITERWMPEQARHDSMPINEQNDGHASFAHPTKLPGGQGDHRKTPFRLIFRRHAFFIKHRFPACNAIVNRAHNLFCMTWRQPEP